MREEWRIYWRELIKGTKSIVYSIVIALLFFLTSLPNLKPEERLANLYISLTYGLIIFAWLWVLYSVMWAFITSMQIRFARKYSIGWRVNIPIGLLGTSGGLITARWVESRIQGHPFTFNGIWESILIGCFISLMFQFYYAYRRSMEQNAQLQAAKAASELHVFKNQMQPHFLFNSLNGLAELIQTNKEYASVMTQKLADLYREILENSKTQLCSVRSEIAIICKYLDLEKLRYGERLSYAIIEPEGSEFIYMPSLVLQTLVENAVKHGIGPSEEGGKVEIKIFESNKGYKVEVGNTGRMFRQLNHKGTGLQNTKSRLELLYGDKHQLSLNSNGKSTTASFWFSGIRNGIA